MAGTLISKWPENDYSLAASKKVHLQKTNEVSLPRSEQQQQQKHTIESGKTIEKAKPNEKMGWREKRINQSDSLSDDGDNRAKNCVHRSTGEDSKMMVVGWQKWRSKKEIIILKYRICVSVGVLHLLCPHWLVNWRISTGKNSAVVVLSYYLVGVGRSTQTHRITSKQITVQPRWRKVSLSFCSGRVSTLAAICQ